jgi:tetratricopeptide (TPR) repeat protein
MRDSIADAVQVAAELAPARPCFLAFASAGLGTIAARKELSKEGEKQLVREQLVPALRGFLQARDLCPLLPEPQRCLANNRDKMARADSRLAYLERAVRVVPYDPSLRFLCGEACLDKQPDQAWKHWKSCLALSNAYLSLILEKSAARLGPREICHQVLPPDPNLLLEAALQLHPQSSAERQPFLKEALDLLDKKRSPMSAEDLHIKALILCAWGRSEEASAVYEAALVREPLQISWRLEFARILYQQKRLRESRLELLIVLSQKPDDPDARALLSVVERKLAEAM